MFTLHKNNSKLIINLNVKCKVTKLLEANIRENLDNLGSGGTFIYNTKGTIHEKNN